MTHAGGRISDVLQAPNIGLGMPPVGITYRDISYGIMLTAAQVRHDFHLSFFLPVPLPLPCGTGINRVQT